MLLGERGAIETKHQNMNRLQQGKVASGKTYADLEKYKETDEFEKIIKKATRDA